MSLLGIPVATFGSYYVGIGLVNICCSKDKRLLGVTQLIFGGFFAGVGLFLVHSSLRNVEVETSSPRNPVISDTFSKSLNL